MRKIFIIAVFLVWSVISVQAFNLPDTGQTTCYDALGAVITCPAPGQPLAQDGSYILHPLSYTDNHDGTVTDNNTGLMWQQEDDGIWYGCWYQAAGILNATCNPDPIIDVCGSLSLGGHSDWRLPNKKELMSILRYMKSTISSPMTDSVFTNVKSPAYWSATSSAQSADRAWQVLFFNGTTQTTEKLPNPSQLATYVRCVRGYEIPPAYLSLVGGYVADLTTGLMWEAGASPLPQLTWEQALSYCEDKTLDFTDWRLPNTKEFESIVDDDLYGPAIDTAFFEVIGVMGVSYWTSTTYAYPGFQSNAYIMNTVSGQTTSEAKAGGYTFRAKCVRGGESGFLWRLLSVDVTGSGTLTSNPSGINCGTSCSAPFQAGSVVTLYPQPAPFTNIFSGWTDCPDSGQVTMDTDKTCTAAFSVCTSHWARVSGTGYDLLTGAGSAYSAAEDLDIIELIGFTRMIILNTNFDRDIRVTLSGGLNCSYVQLQSGYSYLYNGSITVSKGTVTFDKIVIM